MKYSIDDKIAFMNMTLDDKIKRTKQLIMEWYAQYDGKVYVSFSGGKDSTVLLHIARNTLGCENNHWRPVAIVHPDGEKIRDLTREEQLEWIKQQKERGR